MTDEEMVAYLVALPRRARRAAPVDRDAPARVPARAARRPRPRRRDLLARQRARSRRPPCAMRSAPDVAVVDYLRPGFELSKRVAELADARAVVLAHHGLVTWGDTHEESYGLTLELVGERVGVPRLRTEPTQPRAGEPRRAASSSGCAAGSRRAARRARRRTAASAASPTAPTSSGSRRCGARPTTCSGSAAAPPSSSATSTRSTLRGRSGGRRGSCSFPGFGVVAAGPDVRAARTRGSRSRRTRTPRSPPRSTASAAASWLDRRRGPRLRVLAARALQADARAAAAGARRARSCSSPAPPPASAATSRSTSRPAARTCVLADIDADGLAERRRRARARSHRRRRSDRPRRRRPRSSAAAVASFGGLDAVVLNAGVASTGALESLSDEEWRRSLDVNLTAHFLLTRRVLGAAARAGDRRQPRLRRLEERVRPGRRLRPVLGREGRPRPADADRGARGRPARHPRERRQPRRDLRGLEALVGRAPPRARRGARRRRSTSSRPSTRRGACSAVRSPAPTSPRRSPSSSPTARGRRPGAVLPVDGGVPAAFPR